MSIFIIMNKYCYIYEKCTSIIYMFGIINVDLLFINLIKLKKIIWLTVELK